MINEIISLAKALIVRKSTPDNQAELELCLEQVSAVLNSYTIEQFQSENSKSLLIYAASKRPERFKVLLNGHLDIIAGKDYQHIPQIKGDRLYGVGAMDMKANLACLIYVFKQVADKLSYPLGLQIVTDEEIGGFNGTRHQINEGVRADFVLSAEPTQFDIVHQAKGILWLEITARGKTAHGAYPWRGDNAIWQIQRLLRDLQLSFPMPATELWQSTLNLCHIETNNLAYNKVPDHCKIVLDIRFIPQDDERILQTIKALLSEQMHLDIKLHEPAMHTSAEDPWLLSLKELTETTLGKKIAMRGAQGSSDARHYMHLGVPCIEFGPVGEGIGSDEEWVSISSLKHYYQILLRFLKAQE